MHLAAFNFPESASLGDAEQLNWGPPCTDVSRIKSERCGALGKEGVKSNLLHRLHQWILSHRPPSDFVIFMECTRMDMEDRLFYDNVLGCPPFELDACHFAHISRPRWFWTPSTIEWPMGTEMRPDWGQQGVIQIVPNVTRRSLVECLEPSWWPAALVDRKIMPGDPRVERFSFRCLTTRSRKPRAAPMHRPMGISECTAEDLELWRTHRWDQAPYQYARSNCVLSLRDPSVKRRLIACEEERLHALDNWTLPLVRRDDRDFASLDQRRQNLLGNGWHAAVIEFFLRPLLHSLGLLPPRAENSPPFMHIAIPALVDRPVISEYTTVVHALEQVWQELFDLCPYNQDRKARGLPVDVAIGPDAGDLNAACIAAQTWGRQGRRDGFACSGQNVVPPGLPQTVHATLAMGASNPLDSLPPIADDLEFACRWSAQCADLGAWQQQRWRQFWALARKTQPLADFFARHRRQDIRSLAPDVSPSLLDCACRSMGWPDVTLPWLASHGATVVGKHLPYNVFREAGEPPPPEVSMDASGWGRLVAPVHFGVSSPTA